MNNKNHTLITVLLTVIATTLVLGVIYLLVGQRTPETEPALITEKPAVEVSSKTGPTNEIEIKPVFNAGETAVTDQQVIPGGRCLPNGDPCRITVRTEIDLTEPSDGSQLTGRFFIRAYHAENLNEKINELQITQSFNPFPGDGGGVASEGDTKEILTIHASEKPSISNIQKFEDRFYLEYMASVPGWNIPGHVLHIENEGEKSNFDGRFIDFYYSDDWQLDINVPQ